MELSDLFNVNDDLVAKVKVKTGRKIAPYIRGVFKAKKDEDLFVIVENVGNKDFYVTPLLNNTIVDNVRDTLTSPSKRLVLSINGPFRDGEIIDCDLSITGETAQHDVKFKIAFQ